MTLEETIVANGCNDVLELIDKMTAPRLFIVTYKLDGLTWELPLRAPDANIGWASAEIMLPLTAVILRIRPA